MSIRLCSRCGAVLTAEDQQRTCDGCLNGMTELKAEVVASLPKAPPAPTFATREEKLAWLREGLRK